VVDSGKEKGDARRERGENRLTEREALLAKKNSRHLNKRSSAAQTVRGNAKRGDFGGPVRIGTHGQAGTRIDEEAPLINLLQVAGNWGGEKET